MEKRTIWIAVIAFAAVLIIAGMIHLAFRVSERLYLNMYETDEKQTRWIGELYRKVAELERKQVIYEQHMKYEAEAAEKEKEK